MMDEEWEEGLLCAAKAVEIAIVCNGVEYEGLGVYQQYLMVARRCTEAFLM